MGLRGIEHVVRNVDRCCKEVQKAVVRSCKRMVRSLMVYIG